MAAPGLELALGESMNVVICCVFPLHLPQPSWLLHPPIDTRPIDRSSNRFEPVGGQLFHWSPLPEHLQPKSSSNPPSPHLRAAAEAVSSAPTQNWQPRGQRRREEASAMVFDGSCGHRPMIWRPSDMVSIWSLIGDDCVWRLCVVRGWKRESSSWRWLQKSRTLIPSVEISVDCQSWIFVNGYHTNTSYPVSDIRIVHFQGKILWNVEVRARCT